MLGMMNEVLQGGFVRGVFIAEDLAGNVEIFRTASVTASHATGLLIIGKEAWDDYRLPKDT